MPDALTHSDVAAKSRGNERRPPADPAAKSPELLEPATQGQPALRGWASAREFLPWRVATIDSLVMAITLALAWPMRGLVPGVPSATSEGIALAVSLAPWLMLLWVGMLLTHGAFSQRVLGAGVDEFRCVVKGTVATALATATMLYFAELPLSRGYLVTCFVLGAGLLSVERLAIRKWIHRQRSNGALTHRVLLVGSGASLQPLGDVLSRQRFLGYEVVACTLTDPARSTYAPLPAPAIGSVHDVSATCARLNIDTVMVAGGAETQLRDVAWNLEGKHIDLIVVPHLADVSGARMQMRPVAGLPLLHVEEPQAMRAGQWPKRLFDICSAALALFLLAPVMLTVAALIKFSDRGPVFYRQTRVGLNGQVFGCWKFRSMSVNAEAIEAELRSQHNHSGPVFKLERDPRVTRIGQFIRRYSIDELPQLFNVLAGTMSLVGPRPQQQWEVDTYTEMARRRLHVRPGMTGLWQVSGRSNLDWDETIRLDLYYRDNWSMLGDFLIIAKTVKAVVGKDGAY